MNKPKLFRVKRGHWVGVQFVQLVPGGGFRDCYSLRRVVRVDRQGRVTHLQREWDWQGPAGGRANGATLLNYGNYK